MPGLSKVIVLDLDGHAGRQIQLGFQREGVPVQLAAVPAEPARLELPEVGEAGDAGLVVVGGTDARAIELVRRARAVLEDRRVDAPILFAGRGVPRADVAAAGADEIVLQPAYLRDVVTIGRLLRGQPAPHRAHLVGNLAEITGVLTLVRALAALGRSAVLTLMRGLRRGEIRFFEGEVTSAQVGLIHGQAALHQLLLWTDARFDFHHEEIVRRQQIPLTHGELFADAERFLAGVRDSSGSLSPSMVLEQDVARIQMFGKQIPTEVHGVLRMFDGNRVLADVLEDSPYRVFETLRVAQRAVEVGLLRRASTPRPKATWRAVLSIEEWLVGDGARIDADERRANPPLETGPVVRQSDPGKGKGSKRKRKKSRANTPVAATPAVKGPQIDWGSLVPRTVGAEVGPLAGVVPASHASGEILMPTREAPREKLEALMDTGKRERIFPTDVGLEPSVVYDDTRSKEAAERTARELREGRALAERQEREAREAREVRERAAPAPEPGAPSASELVKQLVADDRGTRTTTPTAPVLEPEPPPATNVAGSGSAEAARPVAKPVVTVIEPPSPLIATPFVPAPVPEPALLASSKPAPAAAPPAAAVAAPIEDEPSDGVIRERLPSAQTAPARPAHRPPPGEIPEDDRPPAAIGEIAASAPVVAPPVSTEEPSILVADETAALTASLAAAHAAVSAIATAQAAAAPSPTIATPAREAEVQEARRDATGTFSQIEEEFFRAGQDEPRPARTPSASESFDDLDEGYQPVGFWDRLLGRNKPKR